MANTTVLEILSDQSKWTKGNYALDEHGGRVSPLDDNAVCFCLIGAICKKHNSTVCDARTISSEAYRDIDKLKTILDCTSTGVIEYNDFRSYEEVIELVKQAGI